MLSESTTSAATQVERLKTIFHWRPGSPSHCLLRIYAESTTERVVAVMSKVASNRDNPDKISLDTQCLLGAVAEQFREYLSDRLEETVWLEHYGRFSKPLSFSTRGVRDEFIKVDFEWEDGIPIGEIEETVLNPSKVKSLVPWLHLSPVERDLEQLHLTSERLNV